MVWADEDSSVNGPGVDLHVNFKLDNAGEEIGLYAPDGTLVDSVSFGALGDDRSEGCWPDGAPEVFAMSPPTPDAPNSIFMITGLDESSPQGFTVEAGAMSGGVYRLEGLDDLLETNWMLLDIITADTAFLSFTDTNSAFFPQRFYRLTEQP